MAKFLKVTTWEDATEAEKDKRDQGRTILLNPSHVVHTEQKYKLAKDKSLKMVELSGVAMFGRGIVDVRETIDEIEAQLSEIANDDD